MQVMAYRKYNGYVSNDCRKSTEIVTFWDSFYWKIRRHSRRKKNLNDRFTKLEFDDLWSRQGWMKAAHPQCSFTLVVSRIWIHYAVGKLKTHINHRQATTKIVSDFKFAMRQWKVFFWGGGGQTAAYKSKRKFQGPGEKQLKM